MDLTVLCLLPLVLIIPFATRTNAFLQPSRAPSLSSSWSQNEKCKVRLLTNLLTYDDNFDLAQGEAWELSPEVLSRPYVSPAVKDMDAQSQATFLNSLNCADVDPLWEQVKLEAEGVILREPSAGPQIYTRILSQKSLLHALTSIVSHDIETELMPATSIQNLFFEMLYPEQDSKFIALDVMASTMRSPPSTAGYFVEGTALLAILFHQGLHALVCHRLSHRLWLMGRTGLAYYIQSTLSRKYSTDIHPAAILGPGMYLNAGSAGVVIGETAVVEQDVTICQGVTLGGTGKERGDRHPKIVRGALLQHSCSVLGNIRVGEGAMITAKSIVTKPVPPFARVSGVPAKVKSYRQRDDGLGTEDSIGDATFVGQRLTDLEMQMRNSYLRFWNKGVVAPSEVDDLGDRI